MTVEPTRYYHGYDERYQAVYAQGGQYWTASPDEISDTTAELQQFLDRWQLRPGRDRLIEFGCGEGHLALYLLERGYDYRGVDLSPAALSKAHQRVADLRLSFDPFILGDITRLPAQVAASFEAAVDNFCLHMLVTDGDRRQYLSEVHRVLVPGGVTYFHENYTDHPLSGPVETFEDFVLRGGFTPGAVDDRTICCGGVQRTIRLARLPFRAQDKASCRGELETAGLAVQHFALDGAGHCTVHAKRGCPRDCQ